MLEGMRKFRTIIKQLSESDYNDFKLSLIENKADKRVYVLEAVRERDLTDKEIMAGLAVKTPNSYYSLRSRLGRKLEEYVMQRMEQPRTDILKKVHNINELIFTRSKETAISALKKLETELKDYDLSNELTLVYKSLKKLHINHPNYFQYSQLYNKNVAYMLAIDKAEDMLADYFKKFGTYTLTGNEALKVELTLLKSEMYTVCSLYQSHRLFVFNSCLHIFDRLFVADESNEIDDDATPTEDLLKENDQILSSYKKDPIYFHLSTVFDFLWMCYYDHYNVVRKVEIYYEEINDRSPQLLSYYYLYTFPASFLILKLKRALRLDSLAELHEENKSLYENLSIDKSDIPQYYIIAVYHAVSAYYAHKLKEAITWITNLVNDVKWKNYPVALLEIRLFLLFLNYLTNNREMIALLRKSIQHSIRVIGKENCKVAFIFSSMMNESFNEVKKYKFKNIKNLAYKLDGISPDYFSPLKLIQIDTPMIEQLCSGKIRKNIKLQEK